MPYIVGNRKQNLLLPSCIEDYIFPADPVRVYDAFVEQLDFARLGIELDVHRTPIAVSETADGEVRGPRPG